MILDIIANLNRYDVPKAEAIMKFLVKHDCSVLPDGEIEIEGRDLFVKVMSYAPKPAEENKFETHLVYADLQYIAQGVELMQVVPKDECKPVAAYDKQGDYRFFMAQGHITDLVVRQGEFAVFYPGEAHRPGCRYNNNKDKVKKLVFKIKIG